MKTLHALFATLVFFGLVALTAYGVWYAVPTLFWVLIAMGLVGFGIPGRTKPQLWCMYVWESMDQMWQVFWSPVLILILQPMEEFSFGAPDETASSVVGKNRYRNLAFKWIDDVLSWFDPASGSHGTASIEADEQVTWK